MPIIQPGQLATGSYNISGSFSGSFTGNIVGTITGTATSASYAETASYAVSASHEITHEVSSSYAETASFAVTASHALNTTIIPAGTVSGSTQITALGFVTSSATASFITNSQTSSMSVLSASFATTASHLLNNPPPFPFTGDAVITGSLTITGSFNAFKLNTSNVILGPDAGTSLNAGGINNVVLGNTAASNLTTGDNNVIIGTNAGDGVGTGGSNVAIGRNAGFSALGNRSVLVGDQAGTQGGTDNVFLGYQAGAVGTGNYNVAIGTTALRGNSGGSEYNIAIGYEAGYGVGAGDENVLVGMNAGRSIVTGNANIIIGSGSLGASALERQLRIGHADSIIISASLDTGDLIFASTASAAYFVGNGSGLTNIPASGIVGLSLFRIASGSATASISPDKGLELNSNMTISSGSGIIISGSTPQDAIIISGSNDRTRLHIYDTEDNTSPVYTEGAGIVLTGGEGAAQAILEMSAVGSTNGGSNNEQTFIRSSEMLTITGNSAAAGDNIKLLGSNNYGLRLDASTSAVSLQYITNGGSTVSTLELANGTYLKADANGSYLQIGRSNDWLVLNSYGNLATFKNVISGSAVSASNATFTGDITVLGTASITTLHTTYESASIIYSSGSTKFGDTMDDTHIRTGSLFITGSTTVVGGTYTGDGAGLTNIPASGITGLNLSRIASGSVTASIAPDKGFEINTNITASGNVSSSATSTASFGTYLGDGSQLDGVQAFPFSGSAIITGSLTVSQSVVDFSSASQVLLPIPGTIPLINPTVEYVTAGAITASGTEIALPNNLTYESSSVYEYLEIFINGLRLRYNLDFVPFTTSSVKYNIAIPSGSEVTYKSLKQPT